MFHLSGRILGEGGDLLHGATPKQVQASVAAAEAYNASVVAAVEYDSEVEEELIGIQIATLDLERRVLIQQMKNDRLRRRRSRWVKPWVAQRNEVCMYSKLMKLLRDHNPEDFRQMLRVTPQMFDEILERVTPLIQKETTRFRKPLEPGLKLALTLWHLATGEKYRAMRFSWSVPHNTICKVVREVCKALCTVYLEEAIPVPRDAEGD